MKTCNFCGKELPIPENPKVRNYKFCNEVCRERSYQPYRTEWQRRRNDSLAGRSTKKKQCLICNRWYVQVGSHITQRHSLTARAYREEFDLPLKKGITPKWYKKEKGEEALKNKTYLNLVTGKKFRFKKGDPKAKIKTGWKGRRGNLGYTETDHY